MKKLFFIFILFFSLNYEEIKGQNCNSTFVGSYTVHPSVCAPVCVDFSFGVAVTWPNCQVNYQTYPSINFGDNSNPSLDVVTPSSARHCYSSTGIYNVNICAYASLTYPPHGFTGACGSMTVTVSTASPAVFTFTITPDTFYCVNQRAIIAASGAGNYTWSGLQSNDTLRNDSAFVHPKSTWGYAVSTNNSGCIYTAHPRVVVICKEIPPTDPLEYEYPTPNPSDGKIIISQPQNVERVEITNVLGQVLQSFAPENTNNLTFEFSDSGFYYVNFLTSSESISKKVVITKRP